MSDAVWGARRVYDLVQGFHMEEGGDGNEYAIESRLPTYYEQRCAAYDKGVPEMALDAIQLDIAIDRLDDMPAKAALHLRMLGWDPRDIGAVLARADRKHRTGAALIESGVRQIVKFERERSGR